MFSLARRRREAERHKKLEEQFLKKDANGNGRITAEQMVQIFEENEVQGINLLLQYTINSYFHEILAPTTYQLKKSTYFKIFFFLTSF